MRHPQNPQPVRIAFANGGDPVLAEAVKAGLAGQARLGSRWILHSVATKSLEGLASDLARWRPDAVVLYRCTAACGKVVRDAGLVAIYADGDEGSDGRSPRVGLHYREAGRRAGAFYLERGYAHLAYFGDHRMQESVEIEAGLRVAAGGRKVSVDVFDIATMGGEDRPVRMDLLDQRISAWIGSLPAPCGMILASDRFGLWAAELCHQIGRRVPDQVSLLGVGNHAIVCEGVWPPLSSVDLRTRELGVRAAEILDRHLRGEPPPRPLRIQIPPGAVIERSSTAAHGVRSPRLMLALEHLQAHARERLTVDDLARAAGLSRRSLERRFREHLGQTPLEAIRSHRLERARHLLETTALSVEEVAEQTGFAHAGHLSARFREAMGMPPGRYRRQARS